MIEYKDFYKKILVGITGYTNEHWKNKLKDIDKFKISKVALFLECFNQSQRKKIYKALLTSKIKEIPFVHIRNDMKIEELTFLAKNFKSSYFNIHEDSFKVLNKWKGFYKNLFLEMDLDNFVSNFVKVSKIGGFCIDLAHFKVEEEKWSKEFEYILKKRKISRFFACNHLNGYSFEHNIDIHTIKTLKDFDYLKTLPKFLFGNVIALETNNKIFKQLKFKGYVAKLLNKSFNK